MRASETKPFLFPPPNQNILDQIIFNSTQAENADLNDDGNVDILDIIFMVNLILS